MVVAVLETIYVAVRRIQQDYAEGSPRINPAFVLVLLLSPVVYSLLVLIVPTSWGLNATAGTYSSLKSVPLLYLISGAIALGIVLWWFDRRRQALDAKYSIAVGIRPFKLRIAALVVMLASTFLLTWLSFRFPLACLSVFLALCIAFGAVSRMRGH